VIEFVLDVVVDPLIEGLAWLAAAGVVKSRNVVRRRQGKSPLTVRQRPSDSEDGR
jgi:hypothetical protein